MHGRAGAFRVAVLRAGAPAAAHDRRGRQVVDHHGRLRAGDCRRAWRRSARAARSRAAAEAIARNPGAAGDIRGALLLGLVLIESLAIYVFVISLILFFLQPFA